MSKATRFDLDKGFRDFLERAVANGTIDAAECFVMGVNCLDSHAVVDEVLEAAFANRHGNIDAHRELVHRADELRK